jgi:hypothetical protein
MINHWQLGGTIDLGTYPKNKTVQFSLTDLDSIDNWNKIKDTAFEGKGNWTADSFDYKYNAQGFRSDWDFDPAIDQTVLLGLGCSHTVGVGLPWTDSWIQQLGNQHYQDHQVWNCGLGGGSADTVARLAVNIIPIARPATVAILWPSLYRFETYEQDTPVMQGAWTYEEDNLQYEDKTVYNNQCKNKMIVKLLQQTYGFELLELDVDDIFAKYSGMNLPEPWEKARDGAHMGTAWHWQLQQDMWEKHK